VPGEVIRFVFLQTHYRKPMDWTEEKAKAAEATLRKWRGMVEGVVAGEVSEIALTALADDLNTAGVLTELHRLAGAGDAAGLKATAQLVGLLTDPLGGWAVEDALSPETTLRIETLISARIDARKNKEWAKADAIRGFLNIAGVVIEDGSIPRWRVSYESEALGWLAVSSPAADGKLSVGIDQLEALAIRRGASIEKDSDGDWIAVSVDGERPEFREEVISLAEREAGLV